MIEAGWIKLYRKTMMNPIVMKDGDHLAIWVYLLLNATHEDYPALFGGKRITLKPGQLLTGYSSISTKLQINITKVRRVINDFENDNQIGRQVSNKNSLISILNWESYQTRDSQSDSQSDSQPTGNRQATDTKQE